MIRVRQARVEDCAGLARLRQRSIRQLCSADHRGEPAAIDAWIGDGSATKFLDILNQPEITLLLAECDATPAGLGARLGDTVTLNYVDPDFRFMGVSKAIMSALEREMANRGIRHARLHSTRTALSFYQALGWDIAGEGTRASGTPMTKRLGSH